jgi:hypothetical protein
MKNTLLSISLTSSEVCSDVGCTESIAGGSGHGDDEDAGNEPTIKCPRRETFHIITSPPEPPTPERNLILRQAAPGVKLPPPSERKSISRSPETRGVRKRLRAVRCASASYPPPAWTL